MSVWPPLIHSTLVALSMGVIMAKLGQPKTDRYDFVDLVLAPSISISLLYWGGFYEPLLRGFK